MKKTENNKYMDYFYGGISKRIINKRKEKKLTQSELASKICNVKIIALAEESKRTENNPYLVSDYVFDQLLYFLNVSQKWLLFGDEDDQRAFVDHIIECEKESLDNFIKVIDNNEASKKTYELFDKIEEQESGNDKPSKSYIIDVEEVIEKHKEEIYRLFLDEFEKLSSEDMMIVDKSIISYASYTLKEIIHRLYISDQLSIMADLIKNVFGRITKKADMMNDTICYIRDDIGLSEEQKEKLEKFFLEKGYNFTA